MDNFRKSLSPISDKGWEEITDRSKEIFTTTLSARRFVDVEGPKGLDHFAEGYGRLTITPGPMLKTLSLV